MRLVELCWVALAVLAASCVVHSEPESGPTAPEVAAQTPAPDAAGNEGSAPPPARDGSADRQAAESSGQGASLEEIAAKLHAREKRNAEVIAASPSFAGLYVDRDKIIINLVDLSQADAAVDALESRLSRLRALPYIDRTTGQRAQRSVYFRQMSYSLLQLATWRNHIKKVLMNTRFPEGRLTALGISIKNNAINIGVDSEDMRDSMHALLVEHSIPGAAARVEVVNVVLD